MKLAEILNVLQGVADQNGLSKPYVVGGIPRNIILDILDNLNDVDITTGSADIDELADLFAEALGVEAKVLKDGHKKVIFEGISIDFSSNFMYPNIDEMLSDMGVTEINDLARETYSRDFTVNTLLTPLDFSSIIDLTGKGVSDVNERLLRCPVDCNLAFKHSPIRIIRAFYYSAKYDLALSGDVQKAVVNNLDLLAGVSKQYMGDKVNKIVEMKPSVLSTMIELGVLHKVPMTKELSKALIKNRQIGKVL